MAGPEYTYTEIYKTISNETAKKSATAKPYTITDNFIITLLKNIYKDIPDGENGYWFNNYAKIELPSGGRFYLKREKNPVTTSKHFAAPLSQEQSAQVIAQAAQKAVASGPAAAAFSGFNRNPEAYDLPKKGGKNRRTKRRHHKKRQTKRRR